MVADGHQSLVPSTALARPGCQAVHSVPWRRIKDSQTLLSQCLSFTAKECMSTGPIQTLHTHMQQAVAQSRWWAWRLSIPCVRTSLKHPHLV